MASSEVALWTKQRKDRLAAIDTTVTENDQSVHLSISGNSLQLMVPQGGVEASILCVEVVDDTLEEHISQLNEKLERIRSGEGAIFEALEKTLKVLEDFHTKSQGDQDSDLEEAEEEDDDSDDYEMNFDDDVKNSATMATDPEDPVHDPATSSGSTFTSTATTGATQAIMREYRNVIKQIAAASSNAPSVSPVFAGINVEIPNESNIFVWSATLSKELFKDQPLCKDLKKLKDPVIKLEVTFPSDFPFAPPFVRVVSPRFAFHTGHVTVGGSICMELLTPTGWRPVCSFESVLVSIVQAMIEGGGRVDFAQPQPYSLQGANEAFNRVALQHGWIKQKR